ncbi:hypothetical protein BZA77DRAFT_283384 [Pyronema omphalodes]|nr:hypothetical protein BZA77DRAFT_283384 [Pyronema omphalodes]
MVLAAEWLSALCSLIAAIVAVVTLITVYLAGMQILSRRQLYRLGFSYRSLGPWKTKVVKPSFAKMQTHIKTPTVSLARLVAKRWQPKLTFPKGLPIPDSDLEEGQRLMAEASWVNYLEALGLTPQDDKFYDMQYESELVNGIVPMRWKGKDLVGICSLLGFQAVIDCDDYAQNFKKAMPLPSQWSGPLGWIQFRSSSDTCIAEFRRRAVVKNEFPKMFYDYYIDFPTNKLCLITRLWQSVNGLYSPGIADEKPDVFVLGGAEKPGKDDDEKPRSIIDICDILLKSKDKLPDQEELLNKMFGKPSKWPSGVRPDNIENAQAHATKASAADDSGLEALIRGITGKTSGSDDDEKLEQLQLVIPCPGLLSVIVQGELADTRGLDFGKHNMLEYERKFIQPEDYSYSKQTHPYRLGSLCLGDKSLGHFKKAALHLQPDGFYFTPPPSVYADVSNMWHNVTQISKQSGFKHIFLQDKLDKWRSNGILNKDFKPVANTLYHAMSLCNELQRIKKTCRSILSFEDLRIISQASKSVRKIVSTTNNMASSPIDLIWAMIYSPELLNDVSKRFEFQDLAPEYIFEKSFTAKIKNGCIDCTALTSKEKDLSSALGLKGCYDIPLLADGEYEGQQVLAAFLDVLLTYFWINKKWISNVALYDLTVPQSVTMC